MWETDLSINYDFDIIKYKYKKQPITLVYFVSVFLTSYILISDLLFKVLMVKSYRFV